MYFEYKDFYGLFLTLECFFLWHSRLVQINLNMTSPLDITGKRIEQLSLRHQVLAGNIANAQTPGYKQKDIAFGELVNKQAMSLAASHEKHFTTGMETGCGGVIKESEVGLQGSLDGNTVDLDEQRSEIAKNALNLEAQIRFASHYLRLEQIAAS